MCIILLKVKGSLPYEKFDPCRKNIRFLTRLFLRCKFFTKFFISKNLKNSLTLTFLLIAGGHCLCFSLQIFLWIKLQELELS